SLTDLDRGYATRTTVPDKDALLKVERELEHPLTWNYALEQTINELVNDAVQDERFGLALVDHQLQRIDLKQVDNYGVLTDEAKRNRNAAARLLEGLNEGGVCLDHPSNHSGRRLVGPQTRTTR